MTGLIQVSTVTAAAILVDDNLASNSGTVGSPEKKVTQARLRRGLSLLSPTIESRSAYGARAKDPGKRWRPAMNNIM